MARKGSPGVAIKIEDRSGYSFIDNPALIGGVVGYSPKGEFNKILKITNTANQDSILGLGFNQAKWNMGMYATRAVLNNGGHVHFVRPYGEQVEKTDVRKSDLKSDAFVVSFDRNAAKEDYYDRSRTDEENDTEVIHTSFDIRHFAATRYIADGFAGFGGKRKINTIQETIAENSNVDFKLTAGEEFNEEGKDSDVRSDTNVVLFALVNSDPTSAKRAADRYTATVKRPESTDPRLVTLVCDSVPAFGVGDVIYFPASNFVESEKGEYATVTKILDNKVIAEFETEQTNVPTMANKSATFFCNNDDATTGVDYLEVKTAVANRAVKKYGEMDYVKTDGKVDLSKVKMGDAIILKTPDGSTKITRIFGLKTTETDPVSATGKTCTFTPKNAVLEAGDTIVFHYGTTGTVQGTVDSVDVNGLATVTLSETLAETTTFTSYEIVSIGAESCDASAKIVTLNVTNRTKVLNPVDLTKVTWDSTEANKLVATFETDTTEGHTPDYFAKEFKKTINREDSVVATFEEESEGETVETKEEYIGVNVSDPTAVEKPKTTPTTVNGTLNIPNGGYVPASGSTPATATGDIVWNDGATVPSNAVIACAKGTLSKNSTTGKWTLTYTTEPSVTPTTEDVTATFTETETVYVVTLVFPETLPSKPSKLQTRGTVDINTVSVGDIIKLDMDDEYYVKAVTGYGAITLTPKNSDVEVDDDDLSLGTEKIINLTATTNNILAAFNKEGFAINTYLGNNATPLTDETDIAKYNTNTTLGVQVPYGTATQYSVGDLVVFVRQKNNKADEQGIFDKKDIYEVQNINTFKDIVILSTQGDCSGKFGTKSEWKLVNLTASSANIWTSGKDGLTFNMLGAYDLTVPASIQETPFLVPVEREEGDTGVDLLNFAYTSTNDGVVQRTDKILVSDEIGASFNAMGLASVKYEDVNFNGTAKQVYVLSPEGEAIARMYLYITYHFNGKNYEMEGTIVPYVHDDGNLFIGDVADSVLTDSGARLLINDSGILDNFLTNNAYDLSQSVENGHLDSVSTMLSYDERDPAIINDAIWEYTPANNSDSATLSNAWNLFLDKDGTDVSMLIGAGTGVKNLFKKDREVLDGTVISAILNVCELRKDCFAILDGVGEANIETTLKKMIGAQSFGIKGRWGAIYDGRGVFFDSYYTLMNVEVVKSVQLASIITANAANGIWWLPPAGEINAVIPTEWGVAEKYPRTFKYPEDTDSNIARLTEIRVNPTRFNSRGMFVWGDFTMQKESSAFDQIHVAMLLAGIHKMFYHYLDRKVFQLNTTNLRTNIQSDLQAQLDAIMNTNPAGLYSGTAICDDTNNTPDVIDRNELHVDLRLKPTKTSRWITLRTIVESNGSSNTQTTSLYV